MTPLNSQKLICSKGIKKDKAATEAIRRRQQVRDELERRQLASLYGIDHKEIP
ncbi:MAG: hypothetical protein RIQ83_2545 [Pseudomonadota bacterium]|jgi:cytidylate kinase